MDRQYNDTVINTVDAIVGAHAEGYKLGRKTAVKGMLGAAGLLAAGCIVAQALYAISKKQDTNSSIEEKKEEVKQEETKTEE